MKIGTEINDYETMLKRLLAIAERPKQGIDAKTQAFWDGQINAYKASLEFLHKFKERVFALPAKEIKK